MALSSAKPLNSLLKELFRKNFKCISTNSGKRVLGLGRYGHNSVEFINMDNLAQNTSYRVCLIKELGFCTAPVSPGVAKGDFFRRETGADKTFSSMSWALCKPWHKGGAGAHCSRVPYSASPWKSPSKQSHSTTCSGVTQTMVVFADLVLFHSDLLQSGLDSFQELPFLPCSLHLWASIIYL